MRTRVALMLQMFGLCFRTRPMAIGVVVVIMIMDALAATVLAVMQGILIEHAPQGLDRGVLGVVAVGAVFVALTIVAHRVIITLQRDVAEAVELTLIDDLLGWTTQPATIEHLQEPLFLDRLSVVVRRTQGLAHAVWAAALMLSSIVSVVVSLTVLGRIHPALVGLAAFSIPPIIMAGRAGDLYMQAVDKNAKLLRLEEQLTAVATDAGSVAAARVGAGLFKRNPTVLVLDEPTAALDPQSEHDLFAAFAERARTMRAFNGGGHDPRVAPVLHRDHDRFIMVLDGGRLVEHGTHAELLAAGGTYRALYEAQARGYAESEDATQS